MGMSDYDIAIADHQFRILELTNEIALLTKQKEELTDELNLAHEALRRAIK